MKRILSLVVILLTMLAFTGCGGDKYVNIVKNGKLQAYPDKTIGEAFESKIQNVEWSSGEEGNFAYVTLSAESDHNDSTVKIQFKVNKETENFEINAFQLDGKDETKLALAMFLKLVYSDEN